MADLYYLVSSLPDIEWDRELPFTTASFLSENESALTPLQDNIMSIILINDVQNLESYLKERLAEFITGSSKSKESIEAEFKEPFSRDKGTMLELIESPQDCPEFMTEYLTEYYEMKERYQNIENLYISYFIYLKQSDSPFLRQYGDFEFRLRTVISALRIRKIGIKLEDKLIGDEEFIAIILTNSSAPDFGLTPYFPEISYLLELFDSDPYTREKGIDKLRYDFLQEIGTVNPFIEDTIYAYIIRIMILERWQILNIVQGESIISGIISGEN